MSRPQDTNHKVTAFDPFLTDEEAHGMVTLCRAFGPHGLYSNEGLNKGIGETLPQRFDAAFNYVKTGGRFARAAEDPKVLAARTNYFRETYAYGEDIQAPGIEPFLYHEGIKEAAKEIYGATVVEPAIVFANILVPGQELAIHTDVPEFRGANRKIFPQWLIVVMHHSGLFEDWRMPIATAVSWYHDAKGGAFAYYPRGKDGGPEAFNVRFNTAMIMDTDSVFHGVDRVDSQLPDLPPLKPGMKIHPVGDSEWELRDLDHKTPLAKWYWSELRFSISWKGYCFKDEVERDKWAAHDDDLSIDFVQDRLEEDLRAKGILTGDRPAEPNDWALLLADSYIKFPPAVAEAAE